MEDISRSEQHARGRLQDLARRSGASLAGLSRMIGRNPAYLQQYVTRGSPRHLDEPDLRKIAEFLGVSTRLIETRRFDDTRLDAPTQRRAALAEYAAAGIDDWVEVQRLPLDASAGPGAFSAEEISFDSFRFSRRWLREMGLEGADLTAIRVEGDSMEPLLRSGDEIFVDRNKRAGEGVHVVRIGDALHVKQVQARGPGHIALISANDAYAPIELARDEVEVIGRVVWKGGRV
ncbi:MULTISPECIES: LexA family transcriptional regulator [Qipengyuania]|uniref:LexA family transcriptional regulator n=1 Tax=Qipengyuania soli TaxID=2782568 RepID=A0A7S8F1E9_9SPHN|nr:LexA family transcriptional regulator [Qipengyuania soli]QPC97925.1 LexA family transcriptional regulator [Qipengyuania soli]